MSSLLERRRQIKLRIVVGFDQRRNNRDSCTIQALGDPVLDSLELRQETAWSFIAELVMDDVDSLLDSFSSQYCTVKLDLQ